MIFNTIDFTNYFKIIDMRKGLLPPIQNNLKEIPGKNGSILKNSSLLSEIIEVDIEFRGKNNYEETIRNLSSFLYTKDLKKLRLPGEMDKYYLAKLDGYTDIEKILYYGITTLRFILPDPIAYGSTKQINLSTNTIFHNIATESARVLIETTITTSLNHIKITNQNTGEFVHIQHNFIAGDEVIIDFVNENVTKNGYSIMKDLYLESDFFDINVGENRITSNVVGTLEYIERWI